MYYPDYESNDKSDTNANANSNLLNMTVTRALAELKTLDKRIEKSINDCDLIRSKRREDKFDTQEFIRKAQASYQSCVDLIERRDVIKSKVLSSNAVTKVKIGKRVYTVAEVIDRKTAIKQRKLLLASLRRQRENTQANVEMKNAQNRATLDKLLEVHIGKDKGSGSVDIAAFSKSFQDSNKIEIIDPLNIDDKIDKLEDEITEFEKEADLVLSESNARTTI